MSDWNTIENFDKPPISTNCIYRLYKQKGSKKAIIRKKGNNEGKELVKMTMIEALEKLA